MDRSLQDRPQLSGFYAAAPDRWSGRAEVMNSPYSTLADRTPQYWDAGTAPVQQNDHIQELRRAASHMLRSAGKEPAASPISVGSPIQQVPAYGSHWHPAPEHAALYPPTLTPRQQVYLDSQLAPGSTATRSTGLPHHQQVSQGRLGSSQLHSFVQSRDWSGLPFSTPVRQHNHPVTTTAHDLRQRHDMSTDHFPLEHSPAVDPMVSMGEYTRVPVISPQFSHDSSPHLGSQSPYQQVLGLHPHLP